MTLHCDGLQVSIWSLVFVGIGVVVFVGSIIQQVRFNCGTRGVLRRDFNTMSCSSRQERCDVVDGSRGTATSAGTPASPSIVHRIAAINLAFAALVICKDQGRVRSWHCLGFTGL